MRWLCFGIHIETLTRATGQLNESKFLVSAVGPHWRKLLGPLLSKQLVKYIAPPSSTLGLRFSAFGGLFCFGDPMTG